MTQQCSVWDRFEGLVTDDLPGALVGDVDGVWDRRTSGRAVLALAGVFDRAMLHDVGDRRIAVHVGRDRRYVASVLAAWALGDHVLPTDTQWPAAQVWRVLDVSRPDLVVTDDPGLRWTGCPTLLLPSIDAVADLPAPPTIQQYEWIERRAARRLAYAIHATGGAGEQKVLGVTHEVYEAYVDWCGRHWTDGDQRRALLVTAELTFGMAFGDIAFALEHGIAVHVSPDPADIAAHAALVRDRGIDVLAGPPSTLQRLYDLAEDRDDVDLGGLRLVVSGGDTVSRQLVDTVRRHSPRASFHNVYGTSDSGALARSGPTNSTVEQAA